MTSKFSILVFLFLCPFIILGSDLRVLSSDGSSMLLEFKLSNLKIDSVQVDDRVYLRFAFDNSFSDYSKDIGMPQIPYREINIGVPAEFGNTLQVISHEFDKMEGRLIPIPEGIYRDELIDYKHEENPDYNDFSEFELLGFGEYGVIRNLPVQSIRIFPVQFDASSSTVKIYERIVFRINFGNRNTRSITLDDKYLKDAVLNYSAARRWGVGKKTDRSLKANTGSVLSSGTWYRIGLTEEGIYKIDGASLANYGIDPSTVDPRTIKIYGNGGYQLPENPVAQRSGDLVENAVYVFGEEDGSFDATDYILFYGRGTNFWEYDSTGNRIKRNKHFYSPVNYYWITSGGQFGKRMEVKNSITANPDIVQNTTRAFTHHEDDRINLIKSGRLYVGDEFSASNKSITYISSLSNLVPQSEVSYDFQFVNYSKTSTLLQITENGNTIYSQTLPGPSGRYSLGRLHSGNALFQGTLPNDRSVLKFTFNTNNTIVNGYLDYYELSYRKYLIASGDELLFFSPDAGGNVRYDISNFSNSFFEIFDLTEFDDVKLLKGYNISGGQASFVAYETELRRSKYMACGVNNFKTPPPGEKVDNSDIRGIQPGSEMIIISHREFKTEAERLAQYRSTQSPHKVSARTIYIDEIFNEFSGGLTDPTAVRDFLKYAYDNWQTKPFYVLLFGDGNYDILDTEGLNNNFIPTYQTVESLDDVDAYLTDDYFARISDENDKKLDLAMGRLNVSNIDEARIIVDKIITYENSLEKGLWRNSVTLVADDGLTSDGDDGSLHTSQSETLANTIIPTFFNRNKIYLAAYPTVITGLGRRKPDVNNAIVEAVNNGTLMLNFIGHGNPKVWTHEEVFEREKTIPQFNNDKYFFLTAATCDFGKYDVPSTQSSTELMLFIEDAGMIGGFSASRPVYAGQNAELNNEFYRNLFLTRDSSNGRIAIGHAFFLTKRTGIGTSVNSEKFHLFCDPALKLNEPEYPAKIDSVNGQNLSVNVQIKALGRVSIDGTVRNPDSTQYNSFNGEGIITVFDSERIVELTELGPFNNDMVIQGGVIFRGRVSILGGKFNTSFTVPKDISYENKAGKIVAYIFNQNIDGVGYTKNIIVGGTDSTASDDGAGPEIEIYYDDLELENSYLVSPNFELLVHLEDETGLNTTGTGVGHKLEGILNGEPENPLDFTNFFIGDLDSGGKSGMIKYKFNSLPVGDYSIEIKAWDVFNNFSAEESYFSVVNDDKIHIRDVVNYPNPFSSNTTFTFQHNLNSPVNVKIKIYTIAGRLIQEIENNAILDRFVRINWDGRDGDGSLLANGTYLYKLVVESVDGSFKENVLGKIAVIR